MRYVALLGQPVGHSVSPAMQEAAFAHVGLPWRYLTFDVSPERFPEAVHSLRALGFVGANDTVPHKAAAAALADSAEPRVGRSGACNTLRFTETHIEGFNTDVAGFVSDLDTSFGTGVLNGASVVVVGAGGAARAALLACAEQKARSVTLLNRSRERAEALAAAFPDLSLAIAPLADEPFAAAVANATLVVQTTSAGMSPSVDVTPAAWPGTLPSGLAVYDLIYRPRRTRFLQDAAARGAKVCDGLGMLVEQGAAAFEHWTGQPAPREIMRKAAEDALT